MKAHPAKPAVVASTKQHNRKPAATTTPNAARNQQTRRVLAQHYRAKYGVK